MKQVFRSNSTLHLQVLLCSWPNQKTCLVRFTVNNLFLTHLPPPPSRLDWAAAEITNRSGRGKQLFDLPWLNLSDCQRRLPVVLFQN